ncbi:MAG: sialate O-acetylesterase [Luteolibacter sp.]
MFQFRLSPGSAERIIRFSRRKSSVAFGLLLGLQSFSAHADDIDLYVLAGQSNAQGWMGNAAEYPADPNKIDETIPLYWNSPGISNSGQKWTTLKPQGGRFPAGHFGAEVTFARTLARESQQGFGKSRPAIFKCTLGSTSIASFWKTPGDGGQFDKMMAELKSAIPLLEENGKHRVHVAGFIWIQGESDAQNPGLVKNYGPALLKIVTEFRRQCGQDVPVILGVDEQHQWVVANPGVIEAQQVIARKFPRITTTSLIGLEKADVTHLTPAALVEQGQRLYVQLRQIQPVTTQPVKAKN